MRQINSNGIPKQLIVKLLRYFFSNFQNSRDFCVCITVAATLVLAGGSPVVQAQLIPESQPLDSSCTTMGNASGAITLCIESPSNNSTVSGVVTVKAVLSGPQADIRRAKLIFALNKVGVLTDYLFPYTFELPTDHFPNGVKTLSVIAELNDGTKTNPASIDVRINNNNPTVPDKAESFTPYTATPPPLGQPFVLAAVGDGASGESTSVPDLIASWNPGMFLYLGDVYEDGTFTEFYNWYGSGANYFSRFQSITNPTVGNHEYTNGVAPGYFEYWNNPPQYYSFDIAGWHFISLNSNLPRQMNPGTPQYYWLAQDLAKNASQCTLAYFHEPRYSIGSEGDTPRVAAIWRLLVQHQADIILTGHDHNYQRWESLDGSGNPDLEGITQFIVGSGGHGIRPFVKSDARVVKGLDSVDDTYGALRLELYSDRMTFEYINIYGVILDSGEIPCHRAISQLIFHVPSRSTANVRDCPATNCKRITTLSPGTEVTVLNQVTGEVVSGSAAWFEVSIGDLHGFIHSSLLIGTPKQH